MTPHDLLKWAILNKNAELDRKPPPEVTADNLGDLWDSFRESDYYGDVVEEIRGGSHETGLPCERSRHYESKAVAAQMPDGQWVGWTYWFGGGKHGAPQECGWMEGAYFVTVRDEVRTVQVFERAA